jgi:hypothetical protein
MSAGGGYYRVANRRRRARQRRAAFERARKLQAELAQAHQERVEQERQRRTALDRARALHREMVQEAADRTALSETTSTGHPGDSDGRAVPPPPAGSASTEELLAWVEAAQPILAEVSQEVARLRAEQKAADLADRLRAIAGSGSLATPYEPAEAPEAAEPAQEATTGGAGDRHRIRSDDLTSQIQRVVSRLDDEATDDERARVEVAAQAVVTQASLPPETLLTDLKALVQRISRAAVARRADRQRAQDLLHRLDGLVGPDVDDLRRLLGRVIEGRTPLRDVDEARVARACARAIAEEDRTYVAEQLAAALTNLGYDVDPTFTRDLSAGSPAYAVVSSSPGHAAELRLDGGRYEYRLVHTDPSADSRRDADHEKDLCKAIGHVTAEAHQQGVTFTLEAHRSPGAEPVPYVPAAGAARRARRSDSADHARHADRDGSADVRRPRER